MNRTTPLVLLATLAAAVALVPGASAAAPTRYSIVGGCFGLRSSALQRYVTRSASAYPVDARTPSGAYRLKLRAAALGRYLLLGQDGRYVAVDGGKLTAAAGPGPDGVWVVTPAKGATFALTSQATGQRLAVAGAALSLARAGTTGTPVRFTFGAARGCATYPEAEVGATGSAYRGATPFSDVLGTADTHTHVTAFEFIGGDFHCGRPWSPYGVTAALPDCASIQGPRGSAAPVQNFIDYGAPVHPHDTVGWPTFKDWPGPTKLSYEGTYYTGLKRAYLAGLRLMVTDLVDNEALCTIMPMKRNPCDDMDAVHLQAKDLHELQDYIDAQSGGPGRGWLRIVTNPFEARRVMNEGKLAVIEGIEVSRIFRCGEVNHVSQCTPQQVDAGLSEVRKLGVSSFYPVHKFDNAFGGTKMDGGTEGVLINGANHLKTGHFWDVKTCTGKEQDSQQLSPADAGLPSLLTSPLGRLVPGAVVPLYGPGPHCNQQGLTSLGAYLLNRMIQRHFIIEIDHMDARTGDAALSIIERHHYSGVVSPHDWSSPEQYPRIYGVGGFVNPIAHASPAGFVKEWAADKKLSSPRFHFGFGYGSDMNGLAVQSAPTNATPIPYPFTAFRGGVRFTRERWGEKVFDLNTDGVANYGMYADWLRELQRLGGRPLMSDMFNGAESYLEMWERAYGVPAIACRPSGETFGSGGLGSKLRLGASDVTTLQRAGQPASRPGRAFRWCGAAGRGRVAAVFSAAGRLGFLASSTPGARAGGRAVGGAASGTGTHVVSGGRFVYGVRGGRVAWVGVAAPARTRTPALLRSDVAAAGL